MPVGLRSSGRPKAGRTSITKRVKTALATALLTGLTTVLYAAPPTITARVEPDSIGIGDRFDVVIDAFGAWTEDTLPQHSTSLKHLCDILSGTDTRLLVVGGAGSCM